MQTFDSDGVRIAFIDEGEGDSVLLIHGFASSVRINWVDPGWVSLLTRTAFASSPSTTAVTARARSSTIRRALHRAADGRGRAPPARPPGPRSAPT